MSIPLFPLNKDRRQEEQELSPSFGKIHLAWILLHHEYVSEIPTGCLKSAQNEFRAASNRDRNTHFRMPGAPIKHKKTADLYKYWNDLRAGQPAPRRSALDPQQISGLLGDLFILERKSPVEYSFRLAGTRLCNAYGRELRAQSFTHFWSESDRESIETLLYSITEDAAAAVIGIQAQSAAGNSLPLEMLLLPLFQDNGKLTRVLGSLAPLESTYWIGDDPLTRQSIKSLRLIWPDKKPVLASAPKKAVVAAAAFGQARATRRAANLRVIEGGLSIKQPNRPAS